MVEKDYYKVLEICVGESHQSGSKFQLYLLLSRQLKAHGPKPRLSLLSAESISEELEMNARPEET